MSINAFLAIGTLPEPTVFGFFNSFNEIFANLFEKRKIKQFKLHSAGISNEYRSQFMVDLEMFGIFHIFSEWSWIP